MDVLSTVSCFLEFQCGIRSDVDGYITVSNAMHMSTIDRVLEFLLCLTPGNDQYK